MDSQNIFIFIYNVEYDLIQLFKKIRIENNELDITEFIEEFTMKITSDYDIEDYKKYLTLSATKYFIDTYKQDNKLDFIDVHINQMFNIYNAKYDDFENYSLIDNPDLTPKSYQRRLLRNLYNQYINYESNDSEELFDNIPSFTISNL